MNKNLLFLTLLLLLCFLQISAQDDDRRFQDQFTAAVLHADQLQEFLQPEISPTLITNALNGMDYHHHQRDGVHFWILNYEQQFSDGRTYPMLLLIYQEGKYELNYASSDSSFSNYLVSDGELSQFGYRQISPEVWRNNTYEIRKEHSYMDYDLDGTPDDIWNLNIHDYKAKEERRRKYANLMVSFRQSLDSLEREVYRVNDTAHTYAKQVSASLDALNEIIQSGDDYHNQQNYTKARQKYEAAAKRQGELANGEMKVAYDFISRQYNNISTAVDNISERHKPLTGLDLDKDYSLMIQVMDTLDFYFEFFNADNYTSEIADKIKANDCDELYSQYRQVFTSRDQVEQLYDNKGYVQLKKDAAADLQRYKDRRSKYYNENKGLLTFLNISEKNFDKLYDDIGEVRLDKRLENSRDSILLVALRNSPDITKASLSNKPVVKIDKKYRNALNKSEIDLSQYKGKSLFGNIVDLAISYNEKARKEYTTNGHYFGSKTNFFNSYISPSYASQLQSYKRQEKARKEAEARAREQARKQAEWQEKRRQEQLRRQRAENRRRARYTAYPPIETFAMATTFGYGLAYGGNVGFDIHFGLSAMFPTQRRISWGIAANAGWRGEKLNFYLTGGPQFYHGQSNSWQFYWGLYGGVEFDSGPMGSVRIGTRYRVFILYGEFDVAPFSSCVTSIKMGLGLNFGR